MTSKDIELAITKHARQQMFDCGIDEDQIRRCIQQGARYRQSDGLKSVHAYIGVCYRVRGSKYIIKTVTIE